MFLSSTKSARVWCFPGGGSDVAGNLSTPQLWGEPFQRQRGLNSTLRPSELGNLTMLLHSFNGSVAWYYVGRVIKKLLGAKNWLKYEIAPLSSQNLSQVFSDGVQFKFFKSICVLVAKLTVKPSCCWDYMPPTLKLGSKVHQITISDGPSPQYLLIF